MPANDNGTPEEGPVWDLQAIELSLDLEGVWEITTLANDNSYEKFLIDKGSIHAAR